MIRVNFSGETLDVTNTKNLSVVSMRSRSGSDVGQLIGRGRCCLSCRVRVALRRTP